MIAYAEYKLDKHQWLCEHPNASPEERRAFIAGFNDRRLGSFRKEAETLLLFYAGQYAKEEVKSQLEESKNQLVFQKLDNIESNLKTEVGYGQPVGQSVIASYLFAISLPFIATALWWGAPTGVKTWIGQMFSLPQTTESSPGKR